jgi:uncharacterized protein (TIGR03435 family)
MLQTLLADRFRLVLKREMKEMPVYVLTVADPGKMKLSPEETIALPASFLAMPVMPLKSVSRGVLISAPGTHLFGHAVPMSDLTKQLRQFAGRIVVDKTGRSDVFDVDLMFTPNTGPSASAAPPVQPQSIPPPPGAPPQSPALQAPSLEDALLDQLGLKLGSARMPIEVLVIERVERPSEN